MMRPSIQQNVDSENIVSAAHTNLQSALNYASDLGWPVFPVWPMRDGICACGGLETCEGGKNAGKHPIARLARNGHLSATTDPATIRRWWTDTPDANIAVHCEAAGIVVVDVDPRNGGDATWTALGIPDSDVTAATGGGGRHHFYEEPADEPTFRKLHGIDIKYRGYVLLAPSNHRSGATYAWLDGSSPEDYLSIVGSLPALPDCFLEAADAAPAEARPPLTFKPGQMERDLDALPIERLDDYHDWIALGQALHHQFEGGDAGFDIWVAQSRRSEKFDASQQGLRTMRQKWRRFGRSRRAVTMATVRNWAMEARQAELLDQFDEEPLPTVQGAAAVDEFDELLGGGATDPDIEAALTSRVAAPEWVEKLNIKHAVAMVKGRTIVLTSDHKGDMGYGTPTDLHTFYENVRRPTDRGSEPITKTWMRHPQRRTYPDGIVFAPAGGPRGAYNHWKGFACDPDAAASCALFLRHLHDIVCAGDDATYEWVIRWFAHMVQRPWEKPGTALVLKGCKGSGKDTVGEYVGSLFPRHHTKIANAEHLYGRFNAHQEQTLLLHVEEGFWAGDKKAEGQLKYLVTSEQVQIEPKGVNAFQVASVLRVFVTSNEDWVVPASFDERRFCVLNVSPLRARDTRYFAAIRAEMDSGGREALLHHLQGLSLTGFDLRNPPMTEGLRDQKLASLKNIEKWWFEVLSEGVLPAVLLPDAFEGGDTGWAVASQKANRVELRSAYREWVRGTRYQGEALDAATFGKRLRDLVPALRDARPQGDAGRVRTYVVPPLPACRSAFECIVGSTVEWEA
jgi:hypothetical protein